MQLEKTKYILSAYGVGTVIVDCYNQDGYNLADIYYKKGSEKKFIYRYEVSASEVLSLNDLEILEETSKSFVENPDKWMNKDACEYIKRHWRDFKLNGHTMYLSEITNGIKYNIEVTDNQQEFRCHISNQDNPDVADFFVTANGVDALPSKVANYMNIVPMWFQTFATLATDYDVNTFAKAYAMLNE